ncbi:MAG: thiamine diphosphokinase [Acidimicrobiia bacterium]|nr:MAG: thiamine diphosphokinase [Acidimicrobiia bacterium]
MTTSRTRAVILAGGDMNTETRVSGTDLVIAADSGYQHAMDHSIPVDMLVGDLDSISETALAHATGDGVTIVKHPEDKDETDLELALRTAVGHGATTIDIHGGEGGRLGHLLGVALSIAHPDWVYLDIIWHTSAGIVRIASPERSVRIVAPIGQLMTLLPIGDATGVTTTGLRWPLDDATLVRGTSRGVSNESVAEQIVIEVAGGTVLVIQEGPQAT